MQVNTYTDRSNSNLSSEVSNVARIPPYLLLIMSIALSFTRLNLMVLATRTLQLGMVKCHRHPHPTLHIIHMSF